MNDPPTPAMTVVVMGYRNAVTIASAVASVVAQASPEPFEVVVVTSGGDGSGDVVRNRFPDLVVFESAVRLLPGAARNAGIGLATGDVVAFLAADCLAEPNWIAARLAAHRAGHPVVAGAMTVAPPRRPSAWALHFDLFGARLVGRAAGPVRPPDPATHGLSLARDVLDRMGPFDPDRLIGEDTEAAQRLADLGVPIWFEPRVRTAHRGPQTARALLTDRYRRGRAAAQASGLSPPPISRGRAVYAVPMRWARGMEHTVRTCWRNGSGERGRLVVALPWLAAGRAAGLAGWRRERRVARRT